MTINMTTTMEKQMNEMYKELCNNVVEKLGEKYNFDVYEAKNI